MPWRARLLPVAIWAARVGVAAVFVFAAVPKLGDIMTFAADIRNYRVFPEPWLHLLAAVVPMVELVGAAAVVSGRARWVRAGTLLLGLLTVAFIALIASVIARDIDLECGCFGKQAQAELVGWPTLWRDVGLLLAIGLAAVPLPPPRR
ncbi:MAG: hypothetical protein K1X88_23140 [Nannocystaceae bacterium]|nr:hypothetical protein [Nannocystaceae bacterium]